jgi:hypothetical protein
MVNVTSLEQTEEERYLLIRYTKIIMFFETTSDSNAVFSFNFPGNYEYHTRGKQE